MIGHRSTSTMVLAGLVLLALAGCESDDERPAVQPATDDAISLIRTPAVLDFRTIDRSQLSLEVTLDSETRTVEPAGDGVWRVRFTVPPSRTVDASLTWFERFEGERLPLVESSFSITVAQSDLVFQAPASRYDGSAFDFDSDGVSNVDERRQNTNPLSAGPNDPFDEDSDGNGGAVDPGDIVDSGDPEMPVGSGDGDGDGEGSGEGEGEGGGEEEGEGEPVEPPTPVEPPPPVAPPDGDGDGVPDDEDNCRADSNPDQRDRDGDGDGDRCDDDLDGDGRSNGSDNCPENSNSDQADGDGDGIGNVCDPVDDTPAPPPDDDGDGVPNDEDNCRNDSNGDQRDQDGDGMGDRCDDDRDGDGRSNGSDNCPDNPNPGQADRDGDGIGDDCDPVDDTPVVEADELSGDIVLALSKSGSGSFDGSERRSFEAEVGGDRSFSGFYFYLQRDPDSSSLQTYLELAVAGTDVTASGDLNVRLRSLIFVETRDMTDASGRLVRLAETSSSTAQVTLRPGETREFNAGSAGGDLRSVLSPSVSVPGATWQGNISVTLRYD